MFSFHKPKVYRSSTGCCICRAKSSSSRFTDSRKYEDNLMDCFSLSEQRTGEICNACVLLVKRYKKLPDGSVRNWHHVVDARAGPGTKSLAKFKAKNKKKPKLRAELREMSPAPSDELGSDLSGLYSPLPIEENIPRISRKRVKMSPSSSGSRETRTRSRSRSPAYSGFIDLTYWKKKKVCCGVIFTGPNGAVIVDMRLLKPCPDCVMARNKMVEQQERLPAPAQPVKQQSAGTAKDKLYSDSSSDSGYDDSSNQGAPEGKTNNTLPVPVPEPLPLFLSQTQNNNNNNNNY